MDWRRGRERRGFFYWFRLLLQTARQWSVFVPFISRVLIIGASTLVPLFIMRYKKATEEASKFTIAWSPWDQRDLPGAYLDDEVDNPRILLWSVLSHDWEEEEPLSTHGERVLQSCPARDDHRACFVTKERDYLRRADAVLFDADSLSYYDYPTLRHQGQVWIIRTRGDPPINPSYGLLSMAAKFNWTMSYRGDADVTVPYRVWAALPTKFSNEDLKQIMGKKDSVAVWLVSECEADRLTEAAALEPDEITNDFDYASLLAGLTEARIIKDCGGEACKNRHECLQSFEDKYFFLFVVESSPCFEHPHQLLFDALEYSIIPIYFGSSSLGSTVPPSSVLDATAAGSVAETLSSLLDIYRHHELYLDYMIWKDRFGIAVPRNFLCAVCDALYEKRNRTVNNDVVEWWRLGSECKELPTDKVYPFHAEDELPRHPYQVEDM